MKKTQTTIAAAIRACMESQNITQTQIVRETNLDSRTAKNLIEHGKGSLYAFSVLCDYLVMDFTATICEHLNLKNTP